MYGCIRSRTEEFEKTALSAAACHSADTAGRAVREEPDDMRTEFQRDRDRIIHCKSFRRLSTRRRSFSHPRAITIAPVLRTPLRLHRLPVPSQEP